MKTLLNHLMNLTLILSLLALAVVGSIAGAFLGRQFAVASIALAITAIGLTLALLSIEIGAAGRWLFGIHEKMSQLYEAEVKNAGSQRKIAPPEPPEQAPKKPN